MAGEADKDKGQEQGGQGGAKDTATKTGEDKSVLSKEEADALVKEAVNKATADFDEKLKKAVSTEKDKLYDTIEKEKKRADTLEASLKEFEEAKRLLAEEEEKERKSKMEASERVNELEETVKSQSVKFEEIMKIKDAEFKNELRKRDLNAYKAQKIGEAKGEIIPELVSGTNEEEIDKAVELAKQRYVAILEEAKKKSETELLANGKLPEPSGKDRKSSPPAGKDFSEKSWQELMTMKPEEVKAYADKAIDALLKE